jgi:N-methylhydantoinase A
VSARPRRALVGVDTGGTFTDFLVVNGNRVEAFKVPSTPSDPARAFLDGLQEAKRRLGRDPDVLSHGFTVATNALLTRSGARTVALFTSGFEDLLALARQARPELYALVPRVPEPLVPRGRVIGAQERLGPTGEVEQSLTGKEAARIARAVSRLRPESVAVCLLHSYAAPGHERLLARALSRTLSAAVPISLSSEVSREYREYERASTTVVNAYLSPIVRAYVEKLGRATGPRLRVLQSNGGAVSARAMAERPVLSVLSGPAGGVLGAVRVARRAGLVNMLTLDVGGTSTDVSVYPGRLRTTKETVIGGHPLRIPMLELETVGAGGGSLARADRGGALAVGPESAGADPGPACYGKGGGATVTDAHVVLGRIVPELFLDGAMALDCKASWRVLGRLAHDLGLGSGAASARRAALGVVAVANAAIERALRVLSVARGLDVRDFALVAFGGAGPLHAAELCRELGAHEVLIPPRAGLLSAWGLMGADERHPLSRTVLWPLDSKSSAARVARAFAELERQARRKWGGGLRFRRSADLRYRGQSFEIEIPWGTRPEREFHAAHERLYGYARSGSPIEIVNLNLEAGRPGPSLPDPNAPPRGSSRPWGRIALESGRGVRSAPVCRRDSLGSGTNLSGPALVVEYGATTYLPPSFVLRVDGYGNLRIRGAR